MHQELGVLSISETFKLGGSMSPILYRAKKQSCELRMMNLKLKKKKEKKRNKMQEMIIKECCRYLIDQTQQITLL